MKYKFTLYLCFFLSVCFFAVQFNAAAIDSAEASAHKLTLKRALAHAYTRNPNLEAARSELRSIDENYIQAQAGFKPYITGNLGYTSNYSKRDFSNVKSDPKSASLELSQSLYSGGSTIANVSEAQNKIKAGRANLKIKEQEVFLSGVDTYMKFIRDKEIVSLSKSNEAVLSKHLKASKERYKLGDITKTAVSQAEARLAEAKANSIAAQGTLKKTKAEFEEIFGLSPLELEKPKFDKKLPATEIEALDIAKRNNPLIVFARFSNKAAKDSIKSVEGENHPQVSLSGSVTKTYDPASISSDDTTSRAVGISATIPFYTGGDISSRVREARHLENQKRMDIYSAERTVRKNVIAAWETLKSAEAESVARKAQINSSKMALDGIKVETDFGSSSTLDLLDAEQEYLDAQVSYVSSETDKIVATYSLLSSMGGLTAEGLNLSVDTYKPESNLQNTGNF